MILHRAILLASVSLALSLSASASPNPIKRSAEPATPESGPNKPGYDGNIAPGPVFPKIKLHHPPPVVFNANGQRVENRPGMNCRGDPPNFPDCTPPKGSPTSDGSDDSLLEPFKLDTGVKKRQLDGMDDVYARHHPIIEQRSITSDKRALELRGSGDFTDSVDGPSLEEHVLERRGGEYSGSFNDEDSDPNGGENMKDGRDFHVGHNDEGKFPTKRSLPQNQQHVERRYWGVGETAKSPSGALQLGDKHSKRDELNARDANLDDGYNDQDDHDGGEVDGHHGPQLGKAKHVKRNFLSADEFRTYGDPVGREDPDHADDGIEWGPPKRALERRSDAPFPEHGNPIFWHQSGDTGGIPKQPDKHEVHFVGSKRSSKYGQPRTEEAVAPNMLRDTIEKRSPRDWAHFPPDTFSPSSPFFGSPAPDSTWTEAAVRPGQVNKHGLRFTGAKRSVRDVEASPVVFGEHPHDETTIDIYSSLRTQPAGGADGAGLYGKCRCKADPSETLWVNGAPVRSNTCQGKFVAEAEKHGVCNHTTPTTVACVESGGKTSMSDGDTQWWEQQFCQRCNNAGGINDLAFCQGSHHKVEIISTLSKQASGVFYGMCTCPKGPNDLTWDNGPMDKGTCVGKFGVEASKYAQCFVDKHTDTIHCIEVGGKEQMTDGDNEWWEQAFCQRCVDAGGVSEKGFRCPAGYTNTHKLELTPDGGNRANLDGSVHPAGKKRSPLPAPATLEKRVYQKSYDIDVYSTLSSHPNLGSGPTANGAYGHCTCSEEDGDETWVNGAPKSTNSCLAKFVREAQKHGKCETATPDQVTCIENGGSTSMSDGDSEWWQKQLCKRCHDAGGISDPFYKCY
ncbi:hypothetical protein EX895_003664 [Sporisorium graminicola]|uniref:Uncharacterized protein n=1 Tax=Sporisorium graminicola TaxID=280036 RepID=A0A4U7KSJ6_9BASI|nr:hypothetical protein EX895_003664 [Sporisorium graminicola]TKY86987.1 hypothetical protein EX895_003664 [Sporisorium graminicola]